MFGKRYDGRRVRNIDPFDRILPYVMKTRTDSMNMFEDLIDRITSQAEPFCYEPQDLYQT